MLKKISLILLVTVIMITASTATINEVQGKQHSCQSMKWSGCHGDKGYYTKNGHHHCVANVDKECYKTSKYN